MIAAICDDEKEQSDYLKGLIGKWAESKSFPVEIVRYNSGENFAFNNIVTPCDLLLLDIAMPGINGMELAKKLRKTGDTLPIIFITGFSEYISEGYDVDALHYLLKPVTPEKLYKALDKYIEKYGNMSKEIIVETFKGAEHISVDSIVYVEAFGRKTQIRMADGSVIDCRMNLGNFSKRELKGFVSPHRSYVVNLRYVRGIKRDAVTLDTGDEIPLSRRLYNEVNRKFIEFYTN